MTRLLRPTFSVAVLSAIMSAVSLAATAASDFPTRQINLIVATGPGGAADGLARIIASYMEKEWGKSVIVLNKPGAGGAIALLQVKNEVPDGHTVLIANGGTFSTQWQLMESPTYKVDDFTYIRSLATSSCAWVTSTKSPYKTLKDVWAAAKSGKPVSFGGTSIEAKMYVDYVAKKEGTELAVPIFKSISEALQAALAGHVDLAFSGGSHGPYVKDGTMRVLAATGDVRTADSPDVPTLKEMGYDVSFCAIHAFAGPKGIPADVVNKLSDASLKAMRTPEGVKFLEGRGDVKLDEGPSALENRIKEDAAAFATLKSVLK